MRRAVGVGQWSYIASRRNSLNGVLGVQRELDTLAWDMQLEAGTLRASGQDGLLSERLLGDGEVVSEQSKPAQCGLACSCGVAWTSGQHPGATGIWESTALGMDLSLGQRGT